MVDARKKKILLVDDEVAIPLLLAELFKRHGFDTQVAHTGREALTYLRGSTCDLVITDLRMPEMDGTELIQTIGRKWPKLKVIVMSAYFDKSPVLTQALVGKHVSAWVRKPIDFPELLRVVRFVLEGGVAVDDQWGAVDT